MVTTVPWGDGTVLNSPTANGKAIKQFPQVDGCSSFPEFSKIFRGGPGASERDRSGAVAVSSLRLHTYGTALHDTR